MLKRISRLQIEHTSDYLYRYEGELFTGIEYDLDKQGQIISESGHFQGMPWGFSRTWSSTGILREEYGLKYGCAVGYFRKWYLSGKLKEESFIEHNVPIRAKKWDKDGELIESFDLFNPEDRAKDSNGESYYRSWLLWEGAPVRKQTPETLEFEKKVAEFEQEIAQYLLKYPSNKFYYEKDFVSEH